jgi:putative membrane protein
MRFLLRLLATAAALWVAVLLVPGITFTGTWIGMLVVALVFGLVNAVIRPILKILTCPLVVLTLGLFVFVLNALMLWIASEISQALGIGFDVDGFWAALIGALIVGLVSTVLNLLVGARERGGRPQDR